MGLRQETSASWKILFSENFLQICISQTKFSLLSNIFLGAGICLTQGGCKISHKELNDNNSSQIEISPS